jgi:hypothetical protein
MRANPSFLALPKSFWAYVRTVSQELGYTQKGQIKIHSLLDIQAALKKLGLNPAGLDEPYPDSSTLGAQLVKYFEYRASVLNGYAQERLMDVAEAKELFEHLKVELRPTCPLPLNKQKGDKSGPAYLTGIVNMIIESNAGGCTVNYNPMHLTTITRGNAPVRTLSRRVDGGFPASVNPIAIWEIKEYYNTTTFGSRVADGVYETLLDGMELEELREHEGVHVEHLLIIDSRRTWWEMGRSYLCRIVDMLHMGYVDEVLFGREVVQELPKLVRGWVYRSGPPGGEKSKDSP